MEEYKYETIPNKNRQRNVPCDSKGGMAGKGKGA
jgi:hypothetical protein